MCGYFTDVVALARAALQHEFSAGVYVTVNPLRPKPVPAASVNPSGVPASGRFVYRMAAEPFPIRGWGGGPCHGYSCLHRVCSDLSFKGAAVWIASICLLGDAIGNVRHMLMTGNFALGNAGVVFYLDIICPLLAIPLWFAARREEAARGELPTRLA